MSEPGRGSLTAARLALAAGRRLITAMPRGLRQRLDDRVFYAVFQITRVTNDAYGWRPKSTEEPS